MGTERVERLAAMGGAALAILKGELDEERAKKRSRCSKLMQSCYHKKSKLKRDVAIASLSRERFILNILDGQARLVDGAVSLAQKWEPSEDEKIHEAS